MVVILGILTAIAYPSYRQYVAKAKRNEAKSCLLQVATMQERFYLQNSTYTQDMSKLGFSGAREYPDGFRFVHMRRDRGKPRGIRRHCDLPERRCRSRKMCDIFDRWRWLENLNTV